MTTTNQLQRWCQLNKAPHFAGVFCSNELPDLGYEGRVIFNYSPCPQPGTHWLAFIKEGNRGHYFGSMGMPPDAELEQVLFGENPHILLWIESQVDHWDYSSVQEEALKGDTCGQYACWAVLYGTPKMNPNAWSWLTNNLAYNDETIQYLTGIYSSS